jgi:hypothetical protein
MHMSASEKMTTITKCYTTAASASAIADAMTRASVPYFIVSSFRKSHHERLRHRHFRNAKAPSSGNRKSRFAIMLARSMKAALFEKQIGE